MARAGAEAEARGVLAGTGVARRTTAEKGHSRLGPAREGKTEGRRMTTAGSS